MKEAELRTLADAAVNDGIASREQADAALNADLVAVQTGIPADPIPKAVAEAAFAPPENLFDYQLPRLPEYAAGTKEAVEMDGNVRTWMHEAGLNAEIGTFVAQEADRWLARSAQLSDQEAAASVAEVDHQLRSIWRDDYGRKLGLARRLIADVERVQPGLKQFLNESGLGNCLALIVQVAAAAERRYR